MLLTQSTDGIHALMNKIDKQKNVHPVYYTNTADDVVCDESMNTLTEYLPTVTDSETKVGAPLCAITYGAGLTLAAATLTALVATS
jgi:NAD(P)H-flavin reductase|nr:MAG TPA: hypothetical protein [Caudoviricetes sp.]